MTRAELEAAVRRQVERAAQAGARAAREGGEYITGAKSEAEICTICILAQVDAWVAVELERLIAGLAGAEPHAPA